MKRGKKYSSWIMWMKNHMIALGWCDKGNVERSWKMRWNDGSWMMWKKMKHVLGWKKKRLLFLFGEINDKKKVFGWCRERR